MNSQKSKRRIFGIRLDTIIFFGIPVSLLVIGLFLKEERYRKLNYNAHYTVGITDGFYYGGQSAKYVKYQYQVNGKYYRNSCSMYRKVNTQQGKYAVAYLPQDPKNSLLLLEHPLSKEDTLGMRIDTLSSENVKISWWKF